MVNHNAHVGAPYPVNSMQHTPNTNTPTYTHTHVNMHTHIHSRADTHLGLLGHEAGSTHDASGEHVRVSAHDAVQGDHWG